MFKKVHLLLVIFLLSACNQSTVNNIDSGNQFTGKKLEQDYRNSRSEFEKKYLKLINDSDKGTKKLTDFHDHLIKTLNFIDSLKENIEKYNHNNTADSLAYIKKTFIDGSAGQLLMQKIIQTYKLAQKIPSNLQQEKAIRESMIKFSNSNERLNDDFNRSSLQEAIWILCSYEQEILTTETSNM